MGKNGDPLTGWIKEEVLEQRGCSFQIPTTAGLRSMLRDSLQWNPF